ncbi:MAG: metal ABC transporter substrate-binding protein [Gaiellaceae bacterium]
MRIVLALAAPVCTAVLAAGCGGDESGGSGQAEIVAGFYPLAYAAEQIGGDGVDVANLTPPGVEPHDLELSVRDVERIRAADLVLYLGEGFQPALEEAATETEGDALDLLTTQTALRAGDPHVWLDPLRYADVVKGVGDALQRPQAARALVDRLRALDAELERGLAECDRRELVTSHDAFGYLAERYGLEQVPITGISPEAEPSPRDLERVARLARELGVTTIYFETLVSPEVAETVAREVGAETAVLDPLEGLSDEDLADGEDYFSVMRANLRALQEGLGCRPQ